MNEIIFVVEEDVEGGYNARALGDAIFTQAETLDELRSSIRDAVDCHYDDLPQARLANIILRSPLTTPSK